METPDNSPLAEGVYMCCCVMFFEMNNIHTYTHMQTNVHAHAHTHPHKAWMASISKWLWVMAAVSDLIVLWCGWIALCYSVCVFLWGTVGGELFACELSTLWGIKTVCNTHPDDLMDRWVSLQHRLAGFVFSLMQVNKISAQVMLTRKQVPTQARKNVTEMTHGYWFNFRSIWKLHLRWS